MININTNNKGAAFHFSVEDYIMQQASFCNNNPIMIIWQTDRCIMLGNYQVAEAEIDMKYARLSDIDIIRRSSGGGTIFTDNGTAFVTLISPRLSTNNWQQTVSEKEKFTAWLVAALNKMGISAISAGRNDIHLDGKKICGIAQYSRNKKVCTHASILYNTDLDVLDRILCVDDEKILSKAVTSVRSRVTNIVEHINASWTMSEFCDLLKMELSASQKTNEYTLTNGDLLEIDNIYKTKYGNPSWTSETSPEFSFHNGKRFDAGRIDVYLNVKKGVVVSCSIQGDFLGTVPIRDLEEIFEGVQFKYDNFLEALEGIFLNPYFGNISKEEFLSCIF